MIKKGMLGLGMGCLMVGVDKYIFDCMHVYFTKNKIIFFEEQCVVIGLGLGW